MDLIEIKEWLHQVIKDDLSVDQLKGDPFLERINKDSYAFLEQKNQEYEHPYDDFFDMFKGKGDGYERKTIAGYFYSWSHSSEIINSNNSEIINHRLIEWWDYLEDEMGEVEKGFRYALNMYFYHLKQEGMTLKEDISFNLYEWSRKAFYNEITEFIEQHYEYERLSKGQQSIKNIESEIVKSFVDNLNWLDEHVSLEKVFPKCKDCWWADFWKVKSKIESIDKELNRRNAGPKGKIANSDFIEASELNQMIKKCIDKEELELPETGLYKFITSEGKIKHSTIGDYLNEKFDLDYSYKGIAEKVKEILPGINIAEKRGNHFYKKRK